MTESVTLLRAFVLVGFPEGRILIKLYFMIGLPIETDADIRELVDLIREVGKIGKRFQGQRPRLEKILTLYHDRQRCLLLLSGFSPASFLFGRLRFERLVAIDVHVARIAHIEGPIDFLLRMVAR